MADPDKPVDDSPSGSPSSPGDADSPGDGGPAPSATQVKSGFDAPPDATPKSGVETPAKTITGAPPALGQSGSGAFGPPELTAVPSKENAPPTLVQSQTGGMMSVRQTAPPAASTPDGEDAGGGGIGGGGSAAGGGGSATSNAMSAASAAGQPGTEITKSKKAPSRTMAAAGAKRKKGDKANMSNCRIGFLGAGKIAEAIVKGLLKHSKVPPTRICVSSKSGRTLDHFKQEGCIITKRSYDLFAKLDCDVFFIAVHGHVVRAMFKTGGARPMALTTNYIPNQRHPIYLLSLVGGVGLNDIKQTLLNPDHPEKYKLEMHRIMLNTSVAYGLGLGAIDAEPDSKKCSPIVRDLLTSFAKIEFIPEATMDAACALGGNGLAFVHYFISALSDGGFKMGLPKNMAVKLATKTLQSAAACLLESGKHATELRDQCTSPSGPAIYGIYMLDKKDTGSGLATAVEGAFRRIRELVEVARN